MESVCVCVCVCVCCVFVRERERVSEREREFHKRVSTHVLVDARITALSFFHIGLQPPGILTQKISNRINDEI